MQTFEFTYESEYGDLEVICEYEYHQNDRFTAPQTELNICGAFDENGLDLWSDLDNEERWEIGKQAEKEAERFNVW